MNIKLAPIFALAGLALIANTASATSLVEGSADNGEAKALTCTACHGPEGISANPMWPNIAGQNAPYLLHQLQSFKDGSRVDPLMSSQAMLLSEEDMKDLAVYFESRPAAAQAVSDARRVHGQTAQRLRQRCPPDGRQDPRDARHRSQPQQGRNRGTFFLRAGSEVAHGSRKTR